MNSEVKKTIIMPVVLTALICAILFGGAGYYIGNGQNQPGTLVTITPDPKSTIVQSSLSGTLLKTADWKTYTNNEYGFSFKYPPDWRVSDDSRNSGDISLDKIASLEGIGEPTTAISLHIDNDKFEASIDTYLSGDRADLKSLLKKETVIVGGKPAYVLQGLLPDLHYYDHRLIFANGHLISFSNGAQTAGRSYATNPLETEASQDIQSVFTTLLTTVTFTK